VVLAHDWLCGLRGGEWVLDRIARCLSAEFDVAGLLVMFDDRRPLTPAIDALPRVVARLGRLPLASTLRRWLLPCYPRAVADLSRRLEHVHARSPIALLVSTSSAAIKGLRAPPGVPHLCYIHSPARYIWSRTQEYDRGLRGLGLRAVRRRFMAWDHATAANTTSFLANSAYTAGEVRRCYGRESAVLWPPVRTDFFRPAATPRDPDAPWLVVSALEPYKRVDLAIAAANRAGRPLVVVGAGSDRARLRRLAGPTVTFAGRVNDGVLREHYRTARLLLFPQVEDFGIVAAEAIACGCPVVARRAGGALDIISQDVTGAFFDEPTPEALLAAVARCPAPEATACAASAARFAPERFDREFMEHVRALGRG
jgi:glycosyltransferase involved in cell wall biosynthesis